MLLCPGMIYSLISGFKLSMRSFFVIYVGNLAGFHLKYRGKPALVVKFPQEFLARLQEIPLQIIRKHQWVIHFSQYGIPVFVNFLKEHASGR